VTESVLSSEPGSAPAAALRTLVALSGHTSRGTLTRLSDVDLNLDVVGSPRPTKIPEQNSCAYLRPDR
jgi:hypothetical protein